MVFDRVLERMKNNTMVKSGLEVYSIAKEVYNLVNNDTSSGATKQFQSAEEIYVCAVHKVTDRSEKKIKSRIDYKLVHYTAQTYRKIRSVSRTIAKKIKKRYNQLKSSAAARVKSVNMMIRRGYSACKERFLESRLMRSEMLKNLKIKFYHYQNRASVLAKNIYTQVDSFIGFNDCNQYARKVTSDIKTYYINFMDKAVDKKNVLVDITTNNIASASKMAIYSYDFAKKVLMADLQAFMTAVDTNKTLIFTYLKNLELEMYYSPDQSIKIIETIKQYANGILNKDASDSVSHSSAQAREEDANGISG